MRVLIAIDDTDNRESIGTGKLARMLAEELAKETLLRSASVTRHQLLVHPDIPYTSHNSCACIEGEALSPETRDLADLAIKFLIRNFHEGADPGLCIAVEQAIPAELAGFGLRAQQEVIQPQEAREVAERLELLTWWRGEPWRGCIGAMAGVGLRSTGNDGRFIGLSGIRNITGTIAVEELLHRTGVDKVCALSGEALAGNELIETGDWVRPSLRRNQAVLIVEPAEHSRWRPIREKKRST